MLVDLRRKGLPDDIQKVRGRVGWGTTSISTMADPQFYLRYLVDGFRAWGDQAVYG